MQPTRRAFRQPVVSPTGRADVGVRPSRRRSMHLVRQSGQEQPSPERRHAGFVAVCDHATRDDRTRPDGRQHGATAPTRRARLRRPRRRRGGDRSARNRTRRGRRPFARRDGRSARTTASDLGDGACGVRRRHGRRPHSTARPGRHDHRRRQLVVSPRRRPIRHPGRIVDQLPRRRHERRRLRPRTRLLPDDRRARHRRRTARTDLRDTRPWHRHHRSHARTHRHRGVGGARLAALRPERRRTLREDGPQRHRVRADGRVRRGSQRARQGRHRRRRSRRSTPRPHRSMRRPTTSTTSTSPGSPRCGAAGR